MSWFYGSLYIGGCPEVFYILVACRKVVSVLRLIAIFFVANFC